MVLSHEDQLIVKGTGQFSGVRSKLNDNHIFEFNNILKSYTSFNMQCTVTMQRLSNIRQADLNRQFIQTLFSGSSNNGHWICIFYDNKVIHVYYSINKRNLDGDNLITINRMFPNKEHLRITFETVQYQTNSNDCGLFAISFAVAIVFNVCPCNILFDINKMREHLCEMYETFTISPFPLESSNDVYGIIQMNNNFNNAIHVQKFKQLSLDLSHINIEKLESTYLEKLAEDQQLLIENEFINLKSNNSTNINLEECTDYIIENLNKQHLNNDNKYDVIAASESNDCRVNQIMKQNSIKECYVKMDILNLSNKKYYIKNNA
ncbi:hypothetical protein TSAR_001765 [Trichomalopsis sarcophagae]|uniref:Ubiquitin-like protease family profile domain-containing protein n=1 Tax=Trichomalopsis sarcophagae TaxID=543379 RepID=A0A232EK65_9HYME|nr:hypothetical protein TSAR_001765 [Trichomalopsis sarcophagae]